jgi:beta-phosphoglucomutase-like phosphatase (HAD superfamily)
VSGALRAAPRAVILDMDGLMIDSEVIYRAAWLRAIGQFQREMPDETFRRFLGRNIQDSRALLGEIYGANFDVNGFLEVCRSLAGEHIDRPGIPHKPGLEALLEQLDGRRQDMLYCLAKLE